MDKVFNINLIHFLIRLLDIAVVACCIWAGRCLQFLLEPLRSSKDKLGILPPYRLGMPIASIWALCMDLVVGLGIAILLGYSAPWVLMSFNLALAGVIVGLLSFWLYSIYFEYI